MSYIYIGFLVALACVLYVFVKAIFSSRKQFVLLDAILIWPLILKGEHGRRGKYFLLIGVSMALLLIIAAQFINK